MIRSFYLLAALLCTSILCACGSGNSPARVPNVTVKPAPAHPLTDAELTAARAELAQLACPADADAAGFAELKAALAALLATQASGKSGSQLPNQTKNTVANAQVVSDGAGGFNLTWSYKNIGDYGQNGEVGVSDLTPLGSNLGMLDSLPGWDSAQVADGDANGAVTIADLTPIGANLGAQVSGYKIYGSNSAGGPWSMLLGSVELGDASGTPKTFSFELGDTPPPFILLSAYDASGADWQGGVDLPPAQFSGGSVQSGSSAAIGSAGGTLDGPAGTPLEGVQVVIPAGAIPDGTQINLDYNDGSVTPAAGVWEAPIIELHVDQPNAEFDAPLEIKLPYTDSANYVPVPYYIDENGNFEGCDLASIDEANGTYSFYTWHASQFTTIKVAKENPILTTYHTKFDRAVDGFQVENASSPYTGGNCFGHSSFAGWYFSRIKGSEPGLYNSFMYDVGALKGQHIVATRAHISNSRKWGDYQIFLTAQDALEEVEVFNIIKNMMANQGAPVCLYVRADEEDGTHAHHAILAFAGDEDELLVYDPNSPSPQATPKIRFDEIEGFADFNNGGYNFVHFQYIGLGSIRVAESYMDIWQDAKLQFASADATISNLSLEDGHSTTSFNQPLTFHVDSGQLLIEHVQLTIHHREDGTLEWLDGTPDGSDNYTFNIPLKSGDNEVYFDTKGYDTDNALTSSRNNMRTGIFNIMCTGTIPRLRVELTWDAAEGEEPGEMDLAVWQETNPGFFAGSTYYGDIAFPSGAELKAAPLFSGGPETFILEQSDTLYHGWPYDTFQVRVHVRPTTNSSEKTPYTLKVWIDGAEPSIETGTLANIPWEMQYDFEGDDPLYTDTDWGQPTGGWRTPLPSIKVTTPAP